MTAVKVYHRPAELAATLTQLGWQVRWALVHDGLFWADATRR
jgi:hypothetical protein